MGVQRNLKTLQGDCATIQQRSSEVLQQDVLQRALNAKRRLQGMFYSLLTSLALTAMLLVTSLRAVPFTCAPRACWGSTGRVARVW